MREGALGRESHSDNGEAGAAPSRGFIGLHLRAAWKAWKRNARGGSRLYWAVQATYAISSVLLTMYMLDSATQMGAQVGNRDLTVVSATFDAIVLLLATHLLVRPTLLALFVHDQPRLRSWLALAGCLLLCSLITVAAAEILATLRPQQGPVQEIRFKTGSSEFSVAFIGWHLSAMQVLNALLAYALWSAVYLGWKAVETRRELQRRVTNARLWQLTRQMGPHFLFNAFNSIRGLVFEDQERAAQLITRLSDLLRFQLGMDESTHQTLEQECAIARGYLEIELVRLESRLNFEFDLPPDCLDFTLPTLTVLTAVENAVKHGVAPNPQPGWIRVSAHRGIHGWVLEVINSYALPSSGHSTGIGLDNLRERLALSTNGRAKVEYRKEPETFHLRVELPG